MVQYQAIIKSVFREFYIDKCGSDHQSLSRSLVKRIGVIIQLNNKQSPNDSLIRHTQICGISECTQLKNDALKGNEDENYSTELNVDIPKMINSMGKPCRI